MLRNIYYGLIALINGIGLLDIFDEDEYNEILQNLEGIDQIKNKDRFLNTCFRLGMGIGVMGYVLVIAGIFKIAPIFVGYKVTIIAFIITEILFTIKNILAGE